MLSQLQVFPASSRVIRVTAPQLSKFTAAMRLDNQLTAGDVIERFTSLSRSPEDGARLVVVFTVQCTLVQSTVLQSHHL